MDNSIEKALQRQKEQQASTGDSASTLEQAMAKTHATADVHKTPVTPQTPFPDVAAPVVATATNADITKPNAATEAETASASVNNTKRQFIDIDTESLASQGFVTLNSKRTRINEEYREIKRKLLKNAFGFLSTTLERSNIIMVSSARPSEGKTFTAVNLALSIASEQDKTVLLVDADVLKPSVLKTLDVKADMGLMEYLLDEKMDLSEVLYSTNVDKLKIIPAGQTHHLSTELLASKRMESTIEEFSKRYSDRVVIIDTPPLLGINESAVLAGFAGQAVIVVEEGKAKLADIQSTVERLNPDMAVGFVVNKSTNNEYNNGSYYGYFYGSK
jgi:exopolysaccharide/PEP-CTERM locus tyrosine autokinase